MRKAAELLLSDAWPVRGPAYRLALKACLLGLEGAQKPVHVRKAFELAAREAGVLRE